MYKNCKLSDYDRTANNYIIFALNQFKRDSPIKITCTLYNMLYIYALLGECVFWGVIDISTRTALNVEPEGKYLFT